MVIDRMRLYILPRIARTKNGYRARRIIGAIVVIGALLSFPSEIQAEDARDRLHRIARTSIIAGSTEYNRLLEKKLFVTRDDVARYLFLTNGRDGDRSVAVYQDVGKKRAIPGEFWITATVASTSILECIAYPGQEKPPLKPKDVVVQRYDAPLPASTAKVVHDLWLAMLERSQPEAEIQIAPTVIFSATNSSGTKLRAAASSLEENSISLKMMLLGEDLITYSQLPSSKRLKLAQAIEKEAKRLLERLK
jgi:hypothetical protein